MNHNYRGPVSQLFVAIDVMAWSPDHAIGLTEGLTGDQETWMANHLLSALCWRV